MTNQEMVDKIVNKSGITREQAEKALEINNGDLLDTMIYVEKTYMNGNSNTSSSYSTNSETTFNGQPAPEFNFSEEKNNCVSGNNTVESGKRVISFLTENGAAIYYNEKQLAVIPLIIWLIAIFSGVGTLILVMFVSMFFNVRYELTGKSFAKSPLNKNLNDIYAYIQRLKGNI